jgi:predicted nucleic acid-binding protein
MVVVDSSGWIEFFSNGPKAGAYAAYLQEPREVITPAIVVYEVYKKIKGQRGEEMAAFCLGLIGKTKLVPLDADLARYAADLSLKHSLAMADAVVLATSRAFNVELVTGDNDFRKIPGVRVL